MKKIEIKNHEGIVIYTYEAENATIKDAVEKAVKEKISLEGAILWEADLNGANIQDSNFKGALFNKSDLQGANLSLANLEGAFFQNSKLSLANLEGTNLEGAKLIATYLINTNLIRANLRRAILKYSDFRYANLEFADLREANIEEVNLLRANIKNANFEGAERYNVKYVSDETIMTFGKYKGTSFGDLSSYYKNWLCNQSWFDLNHIRKYKNKSYEKKYYDDSYEPKERFSNEDYIWDAFEGDASNMWNID